MYTPKPTLLIDVDFYDGIIEDPEVTPEYKRQLIEIVGKIVIEFIDIGFGVHPVQQAKDSAAQRWADDYLVIVQDKRLMDGGQS